MNERPQVSDETEPNKKELNFLDLLVILGDGKKAILAISSVTSGVAILVSLLMTPVYSAKTTIMLPQSQQVGASAVMASLGLGAAASALGAVKSADEMYIAFMQSDSLQRNVINKLNLQNRYKAQNISDTREILKTKIRIIPDKKSGLISIEAEDDNADFSAKLANTFVEELSNLLSRLAVTEAQQRKVSFEQLIVKTQIQLAEAELAYREAKEKNGVNFSTLIADGSVRASIDIRNQMIAKEIQLRAMSGYATVMNPDLQRTTAELQALRAQLKKLEEGAGYERDSNPAQQEAVQAYREMKSRSAMLDFLNAQYEIAKVEEAKEGVLIQQVDVAVMPERRARPKRAQMVFLFSLFGIFLGIAYILLKSKLKHEGHLKSVEMERVKMSWRWK